MDYELSIKLNAINNATAQINAVSGAVNKLGNTTSSASSGGLSKFSKTLESTGSRINVFGQRLTWMVSVPLLMFGSRMIDTAMEIETSWVRFRKVFNGTEEDIVKLQKSATELSNKFGRPVEDIINIMTEFNKAGINSVEDLKILSQVVSETAITFDTDMSGALEGTKSIMMGFNLTANETQDALAALNIIADKTTASESGILEMFNRTAGVARQAGFSIRELASSQAIFEKNAIPAGRAGNAMKSILTALTKQSNLAKDQFSALGVDMSSVSWRTADAGDKLNILAKKMLEVKNSGDKLKLADLNEAMSSLVGKFQVNNLNVLLEDLAFEFDNNADTISQFNEGLRVSADQTKNLKFKNQQLQKVLESSPQKLEIMNQMYRNQQAIIGNELLPIKMKFLEIMVKLLEKFNGLSPEMQQWIIYIGLAVVAIGPLLAAIGLMVSGLGFTLTALSKCGLGLVKFTTLLGSTTGATTVLTKALSGGLVLAFAAVAAVLVKKAIVSVNSMWESMDDLRSVTDKNKDANQKLQEKIDAMDPGPLRDKLQKLHDENKIAIEDAEKLTKRYEGLMGVWNAVVDKAKDVYNAIKKSGSGESGGKGWNNGGVIKAFNNGGMVYAANGYLSKGRDTIPAMLSPGEMVLNKSQQSTLFDVLSGKAQMQTSGGPTINLNVGTMVATPGEQRAFARKIQDLINENIRRS